MKNRTPRQQADIIIEKAREMASKEDLIMDDAFLLKTAKSSCDLIISFWAEVLKELEQMQPIEAIEPERKNFKDVLQERIEKAGLNPTQPSTPKK